MTKERLMKPQETLHDLINEEYFDILVNQTMKDVGSNRRSVEKDLKAICNDLLKSPNERSKSFADTIQKYWIKHIPTKKVGEEVKKFNSNAVNFALYWATRWRISFGQVILIISRSGSERGCGRYSYLTAMKAFIIESETSDRTNPSETEGVKNTPSGVSTMFN